VQRRRGGRGGGRLGLGGAGGRLSAGRADGADGRRRTGGADGCLRRRLALAGEGGERVLHPAAGGGGERGEDQLLAQREAAHVLRGEAHLELGPGTVLVGDAVPVQGGAQRRRVERGDAGAGPGGELLERALAHQTTLRDHHQAIHGRLDLAQLVAGQQHGA